MNRTLPLAIVTLLATALSASAQVQSLPSEKLKQIKAATVYIKVRSHSGSGTGSGFVVRVDKDEAWIVTNNHVVTLQEKPEDIIGRNSVEVVFNSGTKEEWSKSAEIMAEDPTWDLAVLRIKAQKVLPAPLPIDASAKLEETAPVYVCGFPFGAQMSKNTKNPDISIGQATISSLRTDDKGEMERVQLNGALNPGNSGGPVVTVDGKLAGVAVTTIRGAGLGFAVPRERVLKMLAGRLDALNAVVDNGKDKSSRVMRYKLIDPYRNLKNLQVTIAVAPPPTLTKSTNPKDLTKEPGATTTTLTPNAKNAMEVESPFTPTPHENYVWHQVQWTDADGKKHIGDTERISIDVKEKKKGPKVSEEVRLPSVMPKTITGLMDPDGKPLPEMAVRLPANLDTADPTYIEFGKLNVEAFEMLGKKVIVDALVRNINTDGYGDGPGLMAYDDNTLRQALFLDFVIDKTIQERMEKFRKANPKNDMPVAARIKATIGPAQLDIYRLVIVDEVGFLNPKGEAVMVFKRTSEHEFTGARRTTSKPSLTQTDSKMKQLLKRFSTEPENMVFSVVTLEGTIAGIETETAEYPTKDRKISKLKLKDDDATLKTMHVYLPESMAAELKTALDTQAAWLKDPHVITVQVSRYNAGKKQTVLCVTAISSKSKEGMIEERMTAKPEEGPRDIPRMAKVGDSVPDNLDPAPMPEPMPETPMPETSAKPPVIAMAPPRKPDEPMTPEKTETPESVPNATVPTTDANPVIDDKPKPRAESVTAAEPTKAKEKEKDNTLPIVIVGAGVGLGVVGLVYALKQSKKAAPVAKKNRRRVVDEDEDDEDDDDEEDEPVRKPKKR